MPHFSFQFAWSVWRYYVYFSLGRPVEYLDRSPEVLLTIDRTDLPEEVGASESEVLSLSWRGTVSD